jgi:hypothetical protein
MLSGCMTQTVALLCVRLLPLKTFASLWSEHAIQRGLCSFYLCSLGFAEPLEVGQVDLGHESNDVPKSRSRLAIPAFFSRPSTDLAAALTALVLWTCHSH